MQGSWANGLGPKIWDFTPGKLLIEEAGGITYDIEYHQKKGDDDDNATTITTPHPPPLDLMKRSFFVASTTELAKELSQYIHVNDKEHHHSSSSDSISVSKKQRIE